MRGGDQRTAKPDPRKEIRVGDHDFVLRDPDRGQIPVLDVAAMAEIVADHELGGLRAHALGVAQVREQRHFGGLELHELVDRPHPLHRVHDRRQQRALDAHGEIDARRLVPRRVHVVDDIDAADESHPAVHLAQLAVQPPQPMEAELPRRDFRTVLEQRDAAVHEVLLQRRRQEMAGAPAVDHHPDDHAAPHRARQRRGDEAADPVVRVKIGLEPDFVVGAIDGFEQRRKILVPVAQERDPVAADETVHCPRFMVSNVAPSAAWSDNRPQGNA